MIVKREILLLLLFIAVITCPTCYRQMTKYSSLHCSGCGMLFTATATDREYCEIFDILKDNTEAYKFFILLVFYGVIIVMKIEFLYCEHFHVFDIAIVKNKKYLYDHPRVQ